MSVSHEPLFGQLCQDSRQMPQMPQTMTAQSPLQELEVLFFLIKKIFFILAALGLCCCTWAFSSCSKWGLLFVAAHGFLIVVASLVAEHGL